MAGRYIVFSMRLATQLIQRGFVVEETVRNAKKPQYYAYAFNNTKEFQKAFKELTGK